MEEHAGPGDLLDAPWQPITDVPASVRLRMVGRAAMASAVGAAVISFVLSAVYAYYTFGLPTALLVAPLLMLVGASLGLVVGALVRDGAMTQAVGPGSTPLHIEPDADALHIVRGGGTRAIPWVAVRQAIPHGERDLYIDTTLQLIAGRAPSRAVRDQVLARMRPGQSGLVLNRLLPGSTAESGEAMAYLTPTDWYRWRSLAPDPEPVDSVRHAMQKGELPLGLVQLRWGAQGLVLQGETTREFRWQDGPTLRVHGRSIHIDQARGQGMLTPAAALGPLFEEAAAVWGAWAHAGETQTGAGPSAPPGERPVRQRPTQQPEHTWSFGNPAVVRIPVLGQVLISLGAWRLGRSADTPVKLSVSARGIQVQKGDRVRFAGPWSALRQVRPLAGGTLLLLRGQPLWMPPPSEPDGADADQVVALVREQRDTARERRRPHPLDAREDVATAWTDVAVQDLLPLLRLRRRLQGPRAPLALFSALTLLVWLGAALAFLDAGGLIAYPPARPVVAAALATLGVILPVAWHQRMVRRLMAQARAGALPIGEIEVRWDPEGIQVEAGLLHPARRWTWHDLRAMDVDSHRVYLLDKDGSGLAIRRACLPPQASTNLFTTWSERIRASRRPVPPTPRPGALPAPRAILASRMARSLRPGTDPAAWRRLRRVPGGPDQAVVHELLAVGRGAVVLDHPGDPHAPVIAVVGDDRGRAGVGHDRGVGEQGLVQAGVQPLGLGVAPPRRSAPPGRS